MRSCSEHFPQFSPQGLGRRWSWSSVRVRSCSEHIFLNSPPRVWDGDGRPYVCGVAPSIFPTLRVRFSSIHIFQRGRPDASHSFVDITGSSYAVLDPRQKGQNCYTLLWTVLPSASSSSAAPKSSNVVTAAAAQSNAVSGVSPSDSTVGASPARGPGTHPTQASEDPTRESTLDRAPASSPALNEEDPPCKDTPAKGKFLSPCQSSLGSTTRRSPDLILGAPFFQNVKVLFEACPELSRSGCIRLEGSAAEAVLEDRDNAVVEMLALFVLGLLAVFVLLFALES